MAEELLVQIIAGIAQVAWLDPTDRALLRLHLSDRGPSNPALADALALAESAVRRRLAQIYAATQTQTRRQLLTVGLALSRRPAAPLAARGRAAS